MNWLLRLLFDWFFVMLYGLLEGLLYIVSFLEQIFDVFAGTTKVSYNGHMDYLINVFFGQDIISIVFWGITAIAMTLCFAFTIVAVARKTVDIGGTVKNSIGQIVSNAGMACISFLLLSVISIAAINLSNVVLVQLNYLMKNAYGFNFDGASPDKDFSSTASQSELTSMARIMNTIANHSLNPSPNNRYNINACFNACRGELYNLYSHGFFDYNYPMNGKHHTWQSAVYQLGSSADFQSALPEDQYNETVTIAITTIMEELKYNKEFKPLAVVEYREPGELTVDTIIFLTASMDAPWSRFYRESASFQDPLRRAYYDGSKSHRDLATVRKDFDIWKIRYEIGFLSSLVFVVVMVQCTFIFITRLINLMLLYLVAPFFVSSIPLDEGQRFQTWRQAFIIQLLSGFGAVVAMRLYLLMIPIIMDSKLVLFENGVLNYMARLLFILGGSFAVMRSTSLITSVLAGTPGAAAQGELMGAALGISAMRHAKNAVGHTASKGIAKAKQHAAGKANDKNGKGGGGGHGGSGGGDGDSGGGGGFGDADSSQVFMAEEGSIMANVSTMPGYTGPQIATYPSAFSQVMHPPSQAGAGGGGTGPTGSPPPSDSSGGSAAAPSMGFASRGSVAAPSTGYTGGGASAPAPQPQAPAAEHFSATSAGMFDMEEKRNARTYAHEQMQTELPTDGYAPAAPQMFAQEEKRSQRADAHRAGNGPVEGYMAARMFGMESSDAKRAATASYNVQPAPPGWTPPASDGGEGQAADVAAMGSVDLPSTPSGDAPQLPTDV